MALCEICNNNEANQTGAHIFPAWMIASAFDDKARNRDNEVIHSFGAVDNELPYFGRSVQPEKIEENIGRRLSEEETRTKNNSFVVDNRWCRTCEKKLKILEDYFLEKVDRQIIDFSNCDGSQIITLTINIYLIRLFIYSLIYRASITKLLGFTLEENINNKLKLFLNKYIKDDLKSTVKLLEDSITKNELLIYPIRCIKTEEEKGKTSNGVYIHKASDKPYCFIINRYIIQFYTKEKHIRSTQYTFFGITDVLSKMENLINLHESKFLIGMFDLKVWQMIRAKFIKYHSHEKVENLRYIYKEMIKKKFGKYPSEARIQKFLNILTNNNDKLGVKYTNEKIVEAMNKSLK